MTSTEMSALSEMHALARKTAALARVAESMLDTVIEADDYETRERLEDLSYLLGATSESADAAVAVGRQMMQDIFSSNRRRQDV
jgi:hypothetical protein